MSAGLAPLSDPAAARGGLLPGQRLTQAERLIGELRSLQHDAEAASRWITASHWQHAADLAEAILRGTPDVDFDPTAPGDFVR